MEIRAEQVEDIASIRRVNIAAFGRENEANLVDQLRGVTSTLSFVVSAADQVVGHVFYSPVTIANHCTDDCLLLGLGPVAILPSHQRQSIGSSLIRQSLVTCARSNCKAVFVLGAPEYYARFGFVPAKLKGFTCQYDVPEEAFMILELIGGALAGWSGIIQYRSEFAACG